MSGTSLELSHKAVLDALLLKGCLVTIDAMGCQTKIAQEILETQAANGIQCRLTCLTLCF